jgi:hypothetical protein
MRFSSSGVFLDQFAGLPGQLALTPEHLYIASGSGLIDEAPNGTATRTLPVPFDQFQGVQDVAVDTDSNVWAADRAGERILKLTPSGAILDECVASYGGVITGPSAIAPAGSAAVWVANSDNRLLKIGTTPGGAKNCDRGAPAVFGVKLSRHRVTSGTLASPRRGPELSFSSSEPAAVTVSLIGTGRQTAGRCRVGARRRGKPCRRVVGRALRYASAGTGVSHRRIHFSSRAIKPGRYLLRVLLEDKSGNRSKPRRVALRVGA